MTVTAFPPFPAAFDLIAPALSEGHYVVAVEFAGHGKSQHRSLDASYMGIHYAEDVIAALFALGWITSRGEPTKPLSLVGHSLGGGIGGIVAATIPKAFSKIVLIESMGILTKAAEDAPSLFAKAVFADLSRDSKGGRVYPTLEEAAAAREANAKMIRGQTISAEGARLLAIRGTSPSEDGGCTFAHDRRAQNPSALYLTEEQSAAFLAGITAPVLAIVGKDGLFKDSDWVSHRHAIPPNGLRPLPLQIERHRRCFRCSLAIVELPGFHHLHVDPDTADAVSSQTVSFLSE